MGKLTELLKACGDVLSLLIASFGPTGTVLLLGGVMVLVLLWRWLAIRSAQRGWMEALQEKERTIQRLAKVERSYRIEALMRGGLSLAEAQEIINIDTTDFIPQKLTLKQRVRVLLKRRVP